MLVIFTLLNNTHLKKTLGKFSATRICKNRISAASDYCLRNQLKTYNFSEFYKKSTHF